MASGPRARKAARKPALAASGTVLDRYWTAAATLSESPASLILEFAGIQTMPPDQAVVPPTQAVFSITSTRKPSAAATAAAVIPRPRRRTLAGRLALDRVDVDRPQAAETQDVHGQPPADPVAVEHADQVVDAVDLDAVEPDYDVAGQEPRLRRRTVRLDLGEQRAHLVLDAGQHRVPPRNRRGLPGHPDIGAADIAVADDLRQHELRS